MFREFPTHGIKRLFGQVVSLDVSDEANLSESSDAKIRASSNTPTVEAEMLDEIPINSGISAKKALDTTLVCRDLLESAKKLGEDLVERSVFSLKQPTKLQPL